MAVAVAVAQSQAVQYLSHFHELVGELESGNVQGAKKALEGVSRASAIAAANGFDLFNQLPSLRKEFVSIRKALVKGDIQAARASLSTLKKELNLERVLPQKKEGDVSSQANVPEEDVSIDRVGSEIRSDNLVARRGLSNSASIGDEAGRGEIRTSDSEASGAAAKVANTSIQMDPSLASFTQAPRVFPTSSASKVQPFALTVTTSSQAVMQGFAAMQADALQSGPVGTAFAPLPEMMLGSRGMSIPAGALLEFEDSQILPPPFAFSR